MTTSTRLVTAPIASIPAPRITAEEERVLVARAQAGGRDGRYAADALAKAHMPYMQRAATRFARAMRSHIDRDEALSACFYGFVEALKRFDVTRGVRFLTYATWWFNHYMQRANESANIFGRAPSGAEEKAIVAIGELGAGDAAAIAARAGVMLLTAEHAVEVYRARAVSLDSSRTYMDGDEGQHNLYERLAAEMPTADEQLETLEETARLRAAVAESLAVLPERHRAVVLGTMMADDDDRQSFADVGRQYGVSRERARQVGGEAKARLALAIRRRMRERMASERAAA